MTDESKHTPIEQVLSRTDAADLRSLAADLSREREKVAALVRAGIKLADACGDIHPTAPSSASIDRLHAAADAFYALAKAEG